MEHDTADPAYVTAHWVARRTVTIGPYTYHRGRTEYTMYAGISGTRRTAQRALELDGKIIMATAADYRFGMAESTGAGVIVSAEDESGDGECWFQGEDSVSHLDAVISLARRRNLPLIVERKQRRR